MAPKSSIVVTAVLLTAGVSLPSRAVEFKVGEILIGGGNSILRFDTAGNLRGSFDVLGVGHITGLSALKTRELLVAGNSGTIARVDQLGQVVDSFAVPDIFGPTDAVAFEPSGTILVAQRDQFEGSGGVLRVDSNGDVLETFAVNSVGGLAVESSGTIVAGQGFSVYFLHRYDSDFALLELVTSFLGGRAEGLGIEQDGTFVLGFGSADIPEDSDNVFRMSSEGDFVSSFKVDLIEIGGVAVAIPEPSAFVLCTLGSIAFGTVVLRRRRARLR